MASDIELTEFLPSTGNRKSVFSRQPHYDLLAFLGLVQKLNSVHLLEFTPLFDGPAQARGASSELHSTSFSKNSGIVFKRIDPRSCLTVPDAFKALISELMVYEHAVVRTHPNIQRIYGVTWDVHRESSQALPVLAFEQSKFGDLECFLTNSSRKVSFMQRLQFCLDIGSAIENLHSINVVLGDIKPKNVLIFPQGKDKFTAKIIDFGCSCFGLDEQDSVTLQRTRGWEAPEYRRGSFTVAQAKKYDIFVYGKVCYWALFGREINVGYFVESSSEALVYCNLQDSVHILQQSQSFRDEFTDAEDALADLTSFFQASLANSEERREGRTYKLTDQLRSSQYHFLRKQREAKHPRNIWPSFEFLWELQEQSLKFSHPQRFDNMTYVSSALALYRIDDILRRLWLNTFSANLTAKRRQIVFLLAHSLVVAPIAFFTLFIWLMTMLVAYYSGHIKNDPPTSSHEITVTRIIMVFLGIGVILMCLSSAPAQFLYHCASEYRHSAGAFKSLWAQKHLVPDLSKLMPLFNCLNYLIRAQIVKELQQRASDAGGCDTCRSEAAIQLALCYEFAFGVQQDKSRGVGESGLCVLAEQVEKRDRSFLYFERNVRNLEDSFPEYFEQDLARVLNQNQIANALGTKIYQKEIHGKEESAFGFFSLPALHKALADVSLRAGRFKGAEDGYKETIRLTRQHEPYLERTQAYSVTSLSKLLEMQGRRAEAIAVLQTIFKGPVRHKWQIEGHIALAVLLIHEQLFDEAIRFNLPGILRLAEEHGLLHLTKGVLRSIMNTLPMALLEQGRLQESVQLQTQYLTTMAGNLNYSQNHKDYNVIFLAYSLCQGSPRQVEEASHLVSDLQRKYKPEDVASIQLKPLQALISTRQGKGTDEANFLLKEALDGKALHMTDKTGWAMGCMSHLAHILYQCVEEEEPLLMQRFLTQLCGRLQNLAHREAIISLIIALSTEGWLQRWTRTVDAILESRILDLSDQLTLQCYLAFILSVESFALEDQEVLDKALKMVEFVKTKGQLLPDTAPDFDMQVDYVLASILSKMSSLSHHLEDEDSSRDFGMRSIQAHTRIVQTMVDTHGLSHPETLKAKERLAAAFARSDPTQVEQLYKDVLSIRQTARKSTAKDLLSYNRSFARYLDVRAVTASGHSLKDLVRKQTSALNQTTKEYSAEHPVALLQKLSLARTHCKLGRCGDAEPLAVQIRNGWVQRFGPKHPGLIHVGRALHIIRTNVGRNDIGVVAEIAELYCMTVDVFGGKDRSHPRVVELKGYLTSALAGSVFAGDEGFAVDSHMLAIRGGAPIQGQRVCRKWGKMPDV